MKPKFKIGDKVKITRDSIEEGDGRDIYSGMTFTVEAWYDEKGNGEHAHPYFENIGQVLYEMTELPFALYEYELDFA